MSRSANGVVSANDNRNATAITGAIVAAGNITGNLTQNTSGSAANATGNAANATNVRVDADNSSTGTDHHLVFVDSDGNAERLMTDNNITYLSLIHI